MRAWSPSTATRPSPCPSWSARWPSTPTSSANVSGPRSSWVGNSRSNFPANGSRARLEEKFVPEAPARCRSYGRARPGQGIKMKNSDREETRQGSEVEQVVTDFQSRTLARMEWHFSRLIYLSSLRDYNTGRYHHHGLESQHSSEALDVGLRRGDREGFDDLGTLPLKKETEDLVAFLNSPTEERSG